MNEEPATMLASMLSHHHYPSQRPPIPNKGSTRPTPTLQPKSTDDHSSERRPYVPIEPLTPPPKRKMGIKDTGDYITARAANPRTGLISPSVLVAQTPRTPMTPGEALRLYSHASPRQSPTTTRPRLLPQQVMQKRHRFSANRWKQHDKGWFMETVAEIASPKITAANTSAARDEDRFVVPMPSAREPQPYQDPARTATQAAALEHCRRESQRLSQSCSGIGLNGRMPSVGAGPRKFAEASRKLRENRWEGQDLDENENENELGHEKQLTATNTLIPFSSQSTAVTFASFRASRSASIRSVESVSTIMREMPGSFDAQISPTCIIRKPIGSPSRKKECKDSDATAAATMDADEREIDPNLGSNMTAIGRARAKSNTSRFQDLRQLPRVRLVHPVNAGDGRTGATDITATLPIAVPSSMLPHTSSLAWPRCSAALTDTSSFVMGKAEPSLFEKQLITALAACATNIPLTWTQLAWFPSTTVSTSGILHALNTLTNEKANPINRLDAAKTLFVTAGRAVVVLGLLVMLIKVGIAIWQVLEVVLWPLSVLFKVLRLVMALA